ncbi:MAG: hypothetical protein WCO56_13090 [Verrucomicrobiota bacterium]
MSEPRISSLIIFRAEFILLEQVDSVFEFGPSFFLFCTIPPFELIPTNYAMPQHPSKNPAAIPAANTMANGPWKLASGLAQHGDREADSTLNVKQRTNYTIGCF